MSKIYAIDPTRIAETLGDQSYDAMNDYGNDRKRIYYFLSVIEDFIFDDGERYDMFCKFYEDRQQKLIDSNRISELVPCTDSDEGYVRELYAERGQEYRDDDNFMWG